MLGDDAPAVSVVGLRDGSAFLAMNEVFGDFFDVELWRSMVAAAGSAGLGQSIFDVQTHCRGSAGRQLPPPGER